MRKRLITPKPQSIRPHDEGWLDLARALSDEVTSEEKDYGIGTRSAAHFATLRKVCVPRLRQSPSDQRGEACLVSTHGSDLRFPWRRIPSFRIGTCVRFDPRAVA